MPSPDLSPPHLHARPEPTTVLALVSQLHCRLWNHQDSGGKRLAGGGHLGWGHRSSRACPWLYDPSSTGKEGKTSPRPWGLPALFPWTEPPAQGPLAGILRKKLLPHHQHPQSPLPCKLPPTPPHSSLLGTPCPWRRVWLTPQPLTRQRTPNHWQTLPTQGPQESSLSRSFLLSPPFTCGWQLQVISNCPSLKARVLMIRDY